MKHEFDGLQNRVTLFLLRLALNKLALADNILSFLYPGLLTFIEHCLAHPIDSFSYVAGSPQDRNRFLEAGISRLCLRRLPPFF